MKWTEKQREAITGRNKNMLVAAAAGSGKTAVLVERIKQLILQDKASISEMLIVTFTNAAAAEMKEKIVMALTSEIEKREGDIGFLRQQLNQMYKANVSTFHAFALEVIRRYFYIIDLEPNFKICDEAENVILKAEAMEELFDSLFKSEQQDFIDFLNKYASSKNESQVKTMIEAGYTHIRSIPDSFEWLRKHVEELKGTKEDFLKGKAAQEIVRAIQSSLELTHQTLERVERIISEQGLVELSTKAAMDVESIRSVKDEASQLNLEELINRVSSIEFQRFTVKKDDKEAYEEIRGQVEKVREKGKAQIKKIKEDYAVRSLDEYVEELILTHGDARYLEYLIQEFHALFQKKKEEKNLLDFSDIEHFALEILKNKEVAEEYQSKFTHIFIDEYQDSNLLQDSLVSKIKGQDNLFMVGDVKQSIYKFRLAEPEIFMEKYERYKKNENPIDFKLDLNQNFRSKGNIIQGVNDVFQHIMENYDEDAALYQGVEYRGDLDASVDLHIIDERVTDENLVDEELLDLKMAELEAHHAVRLIREQLGREIFDVKQNRVRTITRRDIVVLLRATRNYADKFLKVFTEENVPAHVDDSEGYFDTLEIEIMLNLLRVIDNKRQDLPLISLLHSPIMDFTMDELARIRGEHKKGSFYEAFTGYLSEGSHPDLKDKAQKAMDQILEWQEVSKFMPLDDFLWKLLRETGYYNYAAALPSGVQRQANLRLLIDKSIRFQQGSLKGLYGFIHYIDAIKSKNVRTGQISLVGESDDVVRIMTIHKSKGLEFPVVIVAGLGKQFNKSKDTAFLDIHKDLGISLSHVDKKRRYYSKTLLQNIIRNKNRKLDMEEEIRILYVAFTRAMDKLILLGTVKDLASAREKYEWTEKGEVYSARCYLDMISPVAMESSMRRIFHTREEIVPVSSQSNPHKKEVLQMLKEAGTEEGALTISSEIRSRLEFEYGHAEAIHQKSKVSVSELNRNETLEWKQRQPLRRPVFQAGIRALTAPEKGTILHDFMMRTDFHKAREKLLESREALKSYLEEGLEELVSRECFTLEEKNVVEVDKIIRFFESPIGIRASSAQEIKKEQPFSILRRIGEEEVIVQGIIDCYFKEGDHYVILDYKTNHVMDPENKAELEGIKRKYIEQMNIYAESIRLSRGGSVKEAYLYLFEADMEMSVS